MNKDTSSSPSQYHNDTTQFFIGTPSLDEFKDYILRQKRLADLKILETSPEIESSPELSESFELYLQERKKKAKEVKMKLAQGQMDSPRTSKAEPLRQSAFGNATLFGPDDTLMRCTDDSFLANEKFCNNTVNLGNVSENLMDLTALEKQQSPSYGNETHLNDIEAPSFMFNNTSLMSSNKNSPLIAVHTNRPSTILEVSEVSGSNKTFMSSYQTAFTRSGTETTQEYKTACEDSFPNSRSIEEEMIIKMPKIRSFYDVSANMTKDSLDTSERNHASTDMTKDSLVVDSYAGESSSGVESSFVESSFDQQEIGEEKMNDTLERIEYMLAQAEKMREEKTPKSHQVTPKSESVYKPKVLSKATPVTKSIRNSPLMKFSPVAKTPMNVGDSAFKKPTNSSTKIPQPSFSNNKKFLHIASPIARYIKETPGVPMSSTVRVYPGIGNNSPRQFNFRDSESFSKENESINSYSGPSLPLKAKTKSSATSHVYDQRDLMKTPGGAKMHNLLRKSPTITVHHGHVKTHDRPMVFQNNSINDTALSDQSFADLSLISGDVSLQVVEGVKRMMK